MFQFFDFQLWSVVQKQKGIFSRINWLFCAFSFFALLSVNVYTNTMSFSPFKYSEKLKDCTCDRGEFSPKAISQCFHWTFGNILDERNFIAPYQRSEPREKPLWCKGFALSFYTTKDQAILKLKERKARRSNVNKKIGTHVSVGDITISDGEVDEVDLEKHFNLLEYKEVDLRTSFKVLERVLND